jgi:hypothetical protein
MSELTYQGDHRTDGLARLLGQFQGMPRIEAVLGAFLDQIQKVEDVLWALFTEDWIETATGDRLDVLGAIVGEERGGATDDEYRSFIRARVRVNRSTGLLSELVEIVRLIQFDDLTVRAREYYPAALQIEPKEEVTVNAHRVAAMLQDAAPAGVALRFVYPTAARANTLMFDNDMDSGDLTADQCFADGQNAPLTDGGLFAGVTG